MFDLEKEIANWIKRLRRNPAYEDGDIEEIEDHIREEIGSKLSKGFSTERAFESAVITFGSLDKIGEEIIRSRTRNLKSPGRHTLEPAFPESNNPFINSFAMLLNYLKTCLRIIKKDKLFSFLNIASLTLGLFPCILLLLLLQYEYSFDAYHKDADRIYRIEFDGHFKGGPFSTINTVPILSETIEREFPDAGETMVLYYNGGPILMKYKEEVFSETNYLFAGRNLFGFFDIELEEGNPQTALEKHHTMVVTREFANKYFGDQDPIGKVINADLWVQNASAYPWGNVPNPSGIDPAGDYVVTGVVKSMPPNSHIQFDCLLSLESLQWWDMWKKDLFIHNQVATYIKLAPNITKESFERNLNGIIDKYHANAIEKNLEVSYSQFLAEGKRLKYSLIPLKRLHFDAEGLHGRFEKLGTFNNVYYLSVIALIAVIIGCINFINLSTAGSYNRLKEIGIRNVSGSGKLQLITQFLFESVLMTFGSLLLAILMAALVLPYFNSFLDTEVSITNMVTSWIFPVVLTLTVLVGLMAGIYPAYVISKARPALIVKGNLTNSVRGKATIRNILVFFQYGISIVFIMGTIVVNQQLKFIHEKDLGYDKNHVMILQGSRRLNFLVQPSPARYIDLKTNLKKIEGVNAVTGAMVFFGFKDMVHCFLRPVGSAVNEQGTVYRLGFGDINVLENFKIEILEQMNGELPARSYYLTETAVKELGLKNPVGQYLIRSWPYEVGQWKNDLDTIMVAGIIKDIQYNSASSPIEPVAFVLKKDKDYSPWPMDVIYVKLESGNLKKTVSEIEQTWKRLYPDQPLIYSFLDDKLSEFYAKEERLSKLIGFFSLLSILISCLGILGLSAFLSKQKSKEISIRKIFGASIYQVIRILAKNHTYLIALALLVFTPITYLLGKEWLLSYPFRISIGLGTIIITISAIVLITTISISWQLVKGITESPLKTIRNE